MKKFKEIIAQKKLDAEIFRNATGTRVVERMSKNNNVLVVVVKNSGTDDKEATIFDAIRMDRTNTTNSANGISITPSNATHEEIQRTALADPFEIAGCNMIVKNNQSQFSKPLLVTDEDPYGSKRENTVVPIVSRSNKDQDTKMIEMPDFGMYVKPISNIKLTVEGEEEITFVFYLNKKLDKAAELEGRPTLKVKDPYTV